MNPENDKKYIRVHKTAALIVVLMLVAGTLGWWLGRSSSPSTMNPNSVSQLSVVNTDNSPSVKTLVSYVLPDGWKEASCEGSVAVFIIPSGITGVDCKSNPTTVVKLSIDASNSTDCNQLQNVADVKKHICISLYINGHKTLKASTEYLASSSYKQATTINAYYINTGKGVVKTEYIYTSDNQFQAGFDQLASSVKVKP